ncbi:chemotaxis protein [Campylobacter fetus subsp. testudinum]|nr:methyl-accepting chemotaxis protein [Campylobacter fetus]AGZ80961.1 4HB_MCP sensor-containing MCP-domain signal transduction protein [Campylobacter fetus subsp. testudinum 03-427]AJB44717.1 chemotaxis protein [Campylobacter fetus subsp. testudinum]AVK80345.1 methyl-accepting chemotaxis protein [Campylobacter fetus subsp. testudinum]EAI4322319.1 methyl-accepting chemotaxis protein [Campylobacter fetus]EAI4391131.1 methyl-accepting chemotaxis protein [Campylobacter fetus]
MNYFENLKVSTKLYLSFAIVIFLMIIISLIGINRVDFIDKSLSTMTDVNSLKQRYGINFRGSVHDRAIAIRDVILTNENDELKTFLNDIARLEKFYDDSNAPLKQFIKQSGSVTKVELDMIKDIDYINETTVPLYKKAILLKQEGKYDEAHELLMHEIAGKFTAWLAAINKFIDYQENANKELTDVIKAEASGFKDIMIILTLIAIVIASTIGFLIQSGIKRQIGGEPKDVNNIISEVARGNLSIKSETKYENSILAQSIKMQNKLKEIVESINQASYQVDDETKTLIKAFKNVNISVTKQNEIATNSTKIVQLAKQKTENVASMAKDTELNSNKATNLCQNGKNSSTEVSAKMNEISANVTEQVNQIKLLNSHAKDISGAAELISEITDQTNLLALNAAIEAARAGEAGRGFAVVADEIRKLAEKTGTATNEITNTIKIIQEQTEVAVSIIEQGVPKVEDGYKLSNEVAELLNEIYNQAIDSSNKAAEVVNVAENQVESMVLLATNIEDISKVAHDTQNDMNQNQEKLKELEAISRKLNELIGFFKI